MKPSRPSRREFIHSAGIAATALAVSPLLMGAGRRRKRPNILYIMADGVTTVQLTRSIQMKGKGWGRCFTPVPEGLQKNDGKNRSCNNRRGFSSSWGTENTCGKRRSGHSIGQ